MLLEKKKKNTFVAENAENTEGEMLEWLKRHAWKACIRQKRIASSNLAHSAKTVCYITARCFFYFRILKIAAGSNEISTSSLTTEAEFT